MIKGIVLCNELPFVNSIMPLVTPAVIRASIGDLYAYYQYTLSAKKPYFMFICNPETARQTLRIWDIVKGESILVKHYPPHPVISQAAVHALDIIIEDSKAHPEWFAV